MNPDKTIKSNASGRKVAAARGAITRPMLAATHTPGPWTVFVKADRTMMVTAPAGHYVAKVVGSSALGDMRERFAADASLIAASPDLLKALCHTLTVLEYLASNGKPIDPRTLDEARAAIAKATGGAL
jgi:hypothetical protein